MNNNESLSVSEFAAAANVKPQTIYKQLTGRLEPYVITVRGKKRIRKEALTDFYSENQPESTENQLESTENQPNSTENIQPNSTENQPESTQNQQIEALNRLIEMVQNELEEKNKQLAIKDKQIQELNDRLAEAMQLTKGQQYIAAADKTTELLEADNKSDIIINETEPKQKNIKKKSFWQRLFER